MPLRSRLSRVPRVRALRHLLILSGIALLVALGIALQQNERDERGRPHRVGDTATADRVHVDARVVKVNTATGELEVRLQTILEGKLADPGEDSFTPAGRLHLRSTSLVNGEMRFPAREFIPAQDIRVTLEDGTDSAYPLDRYHPVLGFTADMDGDEVPVSLTLRETDPLFQLDTRVPEKLRPHEATLELTVMRSRSTLILAAFMMAIMWGVALAVLNATWLSLGQRRGLEWPALSWLSVTMFALFGFRNAAPGNPPYGSLFDYAAFMWAEVLISLCLVALAVYGVRREKQLGAEAEAEEQGGAAGGKSG